MSRNDEAYHRHPSFEPIYLEDVRVLLALGMTTVTCMMQPRLIHPLHGRVQTLCQVGLSAVLQSALMSRRL